MEWEKDLLKDIRTLTPLDDIDGCRQNARKEVSECNLFELNKHFSKIKESCRAIMEIGVHRNGPESFTNIFLKNKLQTTIYLGVDIVDKSFLNNPSNSIFTFVQNSSNLDVVMNYANSIGITEFDFILIDGNHSINQVLRDWEYTKFLSNDGVVGFHDSAYFYGPENFLKNLNPDKWNIIQNACDDDYDNGIGFCWKKVNY